MVTKKSRIWLPGIVALIVMLSAAILLAGCQSTSSTGDATEETKSAEETSSGG